MTTSIMSRIQELRTGLNTSLTPITDLRIIKELEIKEQSLRDATIQELIDLAHEHGASGDLDYAVSVVSKGLVFGAVALEFNIISIRGNEVGSYLTFEYDEDGDLEIL